MATKLEELGDIYRTENIIKNTYQNAEGNEYNENHPNALSDGDNKGKGIGGNSDQLNTNTGGSDIDINGNPTEPGTGRNALMSKNSAKYKAELGPNGFGPDKPYYPDYIMGEE